MLLGNQLHARILHSDGREDGGVEEFLESVVIVISNRRDRHLDRNTKNFDCQPGRKRKGTIVTES